MGKLEAGPLAGIQNNNNLRQERATSGFDVPHRLIVSYVYDLPFGKGRTFLTSTNRLTEGLIGGWGVNGISTFQAGFPLTFTTSMERRTLPAGLLLSFSGVFKTDWGGMMAASVVTTLPLAVGFLLLQRALVRGLTAGGLTADERGLRREGLGSEMARR